MRRQSIFAHLQKLMVLLLHSVLEMTAPRSWLEWKRKETELAIQHLHLSRCQNNDFFVYHPDIDPIQMRIEKDQAYINIMAEYIHKFVKVMLEKRSKLK